MNIIIFFQILIPIPNGGPMLEYPGLHTPRRFFNKKFKVDFFIDKSKSVKLILKSFDSKYSLILVILSYLFILSHFLIGLVNLFCSISFYGMLYLKF